MATLINRQVTLTEKNDSGPYFDVFYSTDSGSSWYLSPNGNDVYLPFVGSSVIVQVASTTTNIKLVSSGQCTNEVISGTTSTTTSTTTASPTTTTTTTTTCVPSEDLQAVQVRYAASGAGGAAACSSSDIRTVYLTGFWTSFGTKIYSSPDGCNITSGWYAPLSGESGYGFAYNVASDGDWIGSYNCGYTTTTTTAAPTTTTTTTTTCVPASSLDSIVCGYDAGSPTTACDQTTLVTAYKTGLWLDSQTVVYSSQDGCNVTPGYYAPIGGEEGAGFVFQIDQFGDVVGNTTCGTTTTTTAPPVYNVGFRTSGGAPTKGTACGTADTTLYASVPTFAQVGFPARIYSDAQGTPLQGGDTWFGIAASSGASTGVILINNSGYITDDDSGYCTTTTTTAPPTTTTTTTTTIPQYTTIWSDTLPGYGNLASCGCTGQTGTFNYQVLGNNVDIYSDMTNKTVYEDYDTNTLFVGDEQWYCITDAEGTETTISIQINNLGKVIGWVDCTTTTTTTTTSTTTTTTLPAGCYEYLLECYNPSNCQVNYTDCNGDPQSFTQQYEQAGIICARPTPSISGGTVEFLGDCNLTTTTTTSTSTTTTTTTAGPTSMTLYARTLTGTEFTIIYYQVNFGSQISAFNGNLDSNCSQRAIISNLTPGDIITLKTDENEFLAGQAGTTCPTSVGGNTSYTFVLTSGNNNIALAIDTGASTTTTTTAPPITTTTTTTTAALTDWDGVGPYGLSSNACNDGSVQIPDGFKHNGSGTYPTLNDYVYYSNGSPLPAGWYYVSFDDTTIEVETGGRVIDIIQCGAGPQ